MAAISFVTESNQKNNKSSIYLFFGVSSLESNFFQCFFYFYMAENTYQNI